MDTPTDPGFDTLDEYKEYALANPAEVADVLLWVMSQHMPIAQSDIDFFISIGLNINEFKRHTNPLHRACYARDLNLMKILLESKADPNARRIQLFGLAREKLEFTPLESVLTGYTGTMVEPCIKLLFQYGAKQQTDINLATYEAVQKYMIANNSDFMRSLCEKFKLDI